LSTCKSVEEIPIKIFYLKFEYFLKESNFIILLTSMIWLRIFKIFPQNEFGKNGQIANDHGTIGEHLALGLK
jgi:hypothetical protein